MADFIHAVVDGERAVAILCTVVDGWPSRNFPLKITREEAQARVLFPIFDISRYDLHASKHDVLVLCR